jgi:hypothetical protein
MSENESESVAGVYKDADGDMFVLRRLAGHDSGYQLVYAGGSRHTMIDDDGAKQLVKHSTKLDRSDPWQ